MRTPSSPLFPFHLRLQKRELEYALKRIATLEERVQRSRGIMAALDSRNRMAELKARTQGYMHPAGAAPL